MRSLLTFSACLTLASAACAQQPSPQAANAVAVSARAIALNAEDPNQRTIGALRYLGGLELVSTQIDFGGLSGLAVARDESHLLAVTDKGHWVCASIQTGETGALQSISDAWITPLKSMAGFDLTDKRQADSEALAITPDGRAAYVSFEGRHRVWRYDIEDPTDLCSVASAEPAAIPTPKALEGLPVNGGIESLAFFKDQKLLMIGEDALRKTKAQPGWLGRSVEGFTPITYQSPRPFKPTDIEITADGMLILQRHFSIFSGVSAALSWASTASIERAHDTLSAPLISVTLAQFAPPLSVDNFEGLSALPDGRGGYIIYIVSDDNFSQFQRTILLKFALTRQALSAALNR